MYADRLALYRQLEGERESKVIALVNGDRPGLETQLHPEVVDYLVDHLDRIKEVPRISLFLYTCGGDTLAAWSVVQLLHQFCDELEVVVPAKALSAGTLICLGADRIVMTKQAMLGPIDPSINGYLNPQGVVDPRVHVPVGVEEVDGFIEFARAALGGEAGMTAALGHLAGQVHPLVLGNAYRSRMQIRMLAKRLVRRQIADEAKRDALLRFLCGESGSHDYTIFRREARDDLGLRVEAPGETGYRIIKRLYDDIQADLELRGPHDVDAALGSSDDVRYTLRLGLLESVRGGSHAFLKRGLLRRTRTAVSNEKTFQGWHHDIPASLLL